jgi:muramoyltetrapeptide carboxypeptidase LdcA involved in peptidoglycan recycling
MIKPKRLTPGSRIQIVIPASPVRPQFFESGISNLKQMGDTSRAQMTFENKNFFKRCMIRKSMQFFLPGAVTVPHEC